MKTIEKRKVMDEIEYPVTRCINALMSKTKDNIRPSFGSKHLGYSERLKMNAIHAMLKGYINDEPIQSLSQDLVKLSKELVDLFDKVDDNNEKHYEKLLELYSSFYLIYTDQCEGIVVGKYSAEFKRDEFGEISVAVIDEASGSVRVRNLEDHEDFEDFGGVLTMFKVYLEQLKDKENFKVAKGLIPIVDGYIEEFDISTYYRSGYSQFEGTFLCLPASK